MLARFCKSLVCVAAIAGLGVGLVGCGSAPKSNKPQAAAGTYSFWPPAPVEPRIQFVGTFDSSEDISPVKTSDLERVVFGADAAKPAEVQKPYGVAIRDGKIYVCDIRAKAVVVLDFAKKQTRLVGTTGANRLDRPVAVTVADDGTIYVCDGVQQAIFVFGKDERFSMALPISGLKPAGIAVFGDRLYVSDIKRQAVVVLNRTTGKEIRTIGTVGDEDGQFRLPLGVSVDKSGNLYVVDMMRCRVQKFDSEGTFVSGYGEAGDHVGGFARPKQIAVDSEGIIYIVDSAFQNVQMFNNKFELLMFFGAAGNFPGSMSLPVGVAVTDTGLQYFQDRIHPGFKIKRLIVVANQFGGNKIGVYALGDRKSSYALEDLRKSGNTIAEGVGVPTDEQLKFQNIGGEAPPDAGNEPAPSLEEPASGGGTKP